MELVVNGFVDRIFRYIFKIVYFIRNIEKVFFRVFESFELFNNIKGDRVFVSY